MRSRLKRERQLAGFTQAEVAVIIGVSQQTVSKYECEMITPAEFKTIREFEKLFGVQAEDLFPDIFNS